MPNTTPPPPPPRKLAEGTSPGRKLPTYVEDARNAKDLRRFFAGAASEPASAEAAFGEYLVAQGVLDRQQLFRALQMQDRVTGARVGECAAALGFAPIRAIEARYAAFATTTR